MVMINVNMDEIKNEFELLPTGIYDLRIMGSPPIKDGAKGPYMALEFTVENGEFAGRKLWDNISFVAGWKIKAIAESAGLQTAGVTGFDSDSLADMVVKASVVEDSYKNTAGEIVPKNSVKNYITEKTE